MLSIQSHGKVMVLKLMGELRSEHIDEVSELVEEKIEAHDDALVLIDLRQYDGAHDLHTAWQEFRLVTHYADKVDKIAVVGSVDWQRFATYLVSPFTRAHERFFAPEDADEAFKWLRA